jgi:hypothetical protein
MTAPSRYGISTPCRKWRALLVCPCVCICVCSFNGLSLTYALAPVARCTCCLYVCAHSRWHVTCMPTHLSTNPCSHPPTNLYFHLARQPGQPGHTPCISTHELTHPPRRADIHRYVETLYGHQEGVLAIESLDRDRAVSCGGRDRSVRLWKVEEESHNVYDGTGQSIDCIAMLTEGAVS